MIDEEETYKRFGHRSTDLKPKSHKKIIAICDVCGMTRELLKQDYRAVCRSCSSSKTGKALIGRNNPAWKGGKIKRNCLQCGSVFYVKQYDLKQGHGKYCSPICQGLANRNENNPNYQGGNVKRICEICGTPFEVKQNRANKNMGRFCSRKCMGIASRGVNHPNWQGGKTVEPYCEKWNEMFREYIRNKFNRKCFLCGKTEAENGGRRLSVHHVSYNKACGCAETTEEKEEDDSTCQFVPLCMSCHTKVHRAKDREKCEKLIKNKMRNKLNGWYI